MCTDRDPRPCEHAGHRVVQLDRLQDRNARLTTTMKELRKELAEAKRAGKCQAAPFSKGGRTDKPSRPDRKPGMENFSYRKPPSADELSGPPVDVVYVTDIPEMPRPQVTEYRVQVCRCRGCGRRVRGRHAEVGAGPVRGECAPYG